jgi:integrase
VLPGWIVRWRNVDLDRAALRIVEQTKSALRFKSPIMPAPPYSRTFAIEELRRLKWEQAESLLMLGVRQTGDTSGCSRRDGEPLQPQSLTHEFPRFFARLKDFPFHELRHSHATAGRLDAAFRGAMMGPAKPG